MGAIDELLNGGGGKGGAPTPAPAPGGGAIAGLLARGGAPVPAAKKSGKGFFGINLPKIPLVHWDLPAVGVHTDKHNPLTQVANMVTSAGPGLVRLGGSLASELRPSNPFNARALPAKDRGWHSVKQQMPVTSELVTSPVRTLREIPDTAAAVRPGGPGFGQSMLGKEIKEHGYLSTGLGKVADLTTLAGGVGLLGKAAGAGRLAEAARLERLAGLSSEAAGLGKVADEAKLAKAAFEADAAGDAAKAADLAKAADQASQAANLRRFVEQSGGVERAGNRVTAGATKTSHLFGRVAAAPFAPTEKALGLAGRAAGLAAKSSALEPYAERLSGLLDRARTRKSVDELFHEQVRAPLEAELHDLFERHGIEDAARHTTPDEQAAIYLSKAKQGLTPGARRAIDALASDEAGPGLADLKPDVFKVAFPDGSVTPEQYRLARQFEDGTLPPAQQARMQAAADALTEVQGRRERKIYVTGEGTSHPLSDEALANRQARVEGRQAPADIESAKDTRTPTVEQQRAGKAPRKVSTLKAKLEGVRSQLDELQHGEAPEPVPFSAAQERRTGVLAERTRRAEAVHREETRRYGAPSERAQRRLEQSQSAERAARDRFERENQVRGDRAAQKRFEQLQERERRTLDEITRAEEEARNSIEAAPPQDRPALRTNYEIKKLALDLAEAHPDRAADFKALADGIETTKADLEKAGVKTEWFFGGKAEGRPATVPPTPTMRQARRLASERQRLGTTLERDIQSQTEKYAHEARNVLYNKFRGHVQENLGSTIGERLKPERFATGEDLAAGLKEHDLVAWDPRTGKEITDPALLDKDTAVLPKALHEQLTKYTGSGKSGALGTALKVYDKATGKWKHSVLALSPRWNVGNIVGNAALATVGAGLTPGQIAAHIGEARRLVKDFDEGRPVPAEHEAALQRLLSSGYHVSDLAAEGERGMAKARNRLSRAVEGSGEGRLSGAREAAAHPISKSYAANEYIDNVNRTMIYLAKHKTGVSAEAAVQLALKAAGDFNKMTPFERGVVRRVIPFYAWQRHITRLAFSLPIEAPARVAWTLHLADLENQIHPDPGADNPFNSGTIPGPGGKRINVSQFFPFSSSFFTDPTFRGAGYQVNPVLKAGVAAATGYNLGKMKPVSGRGINVDATTGKDNPSGYGASPQLLALKHPQAFAAFLAQQFPQVTTARDLAAGNAPVRYDTGEPRKVGPGATKKHAKPTLTGRKRGQTVARFFGVPVPEPEQKQTTKKKR